MRAPLALLAVPALALALASCGSDEPENPTGVSQSGEAVECPPAEGVETPVQTFEQAPPMCIDEAKTYTAVVTTDVGDVTFALDAKKAPKTVNNFVVLSRYGYYDGVPFHRVIPGFMIQGGDPTGQGNGGPGYEFEDELPAAGEYEIGSLAMANAGPDTNGSQFFVVTGDSGVALPPDYSLFGKVTSGMETVREIEEDGSPDGSPGEQHTIDSITITEK
ncbi:peptidylprolyl isomerase [Janibacter melonis]|uniref:Peptidyl-prolyl cis-trans isomerase n=1 Tax=Janibacter melonis TaxID=262209 RepID=A0A650GF64_9MICO|nr:peptidylprolyl isomerase [Janibacter melonis]MCB5992001.1 peptidylprolyl isomerase [Janibacter melonis]QGX08634.1 peptidylprolyl isomerase [Janibacter melonis]